MDLRHVVVPFSTVSGIIWFAEGSSWNSTRRPLWVHTILAFNMQRMYFLNRLMGVCAKYSRGATIVFPSIFIVSGSVSGITCVFPEKPTVRMDELERGRLKTFFPMHEYVAPVSIMKAHSGPFTITGMVGSSRGCNEMTGDIVSPSGFSGHLYCQPAAGPTGGFVGQSCL